MRIYFFPSEHGTPENASYEHCMVALAEGLQSLGYEVAGFRNYWPSKNNWLIPKTEESPEDFDVVVISNEWLHRYNSLPNEYIKLKNPRKIYIDASDGWKTDAIINNDWPADLILRTHYVQSHKYHKKVKPWAFGLTNRIINAIETVKPLAKRNKSIVCNFRVGHPVRDYFTATLKKLLSHDFYWDTSIDTNPPEDSINKKYWELTGRRHYPQFYEKLNNSILCAAFGGYFCPSLPNSVSTFYGRLNYKLIQSLKIPTHTLGQFDSWRFWESLISGCITIHVDLNYYHCLLPVMPENSTDYLGITAKTKKEEFREILNYLLYNNNGRNWALAYYSPKETAKRLLEYLY